ncbi:MAG: GNAT family N-acetyltransferase [Verrucomicrobia bacterium]|nr:GNAT family N-acetyltransferase [Verrucomicrobiota bacterium]
MRNLFSRILRGATLICLTGNLMALDLCQKVQEFSEVLSSQKSIELKLLKDCPEVIPTLGQWKYEEWHSHDTSLTVEKAINGFKKYLSDTDVPFALVAFQDNRPIAVISLKAHGGAAFADLAGPHEAWGGILRVIPEARNKGLAKTLGHLLMTIARQLGYTSIYFYTTNPSNIPLYMKYGAEIVETRLARGRMVTILKIPLQSE